MVTTREGARSAMLTGLGLAALTGLGPAALAVAGGPPAPDPARAVSQASQTVREASRAREVATRDEAEGARDPFVRPTTPGSPRHAEVRPSGLSGLAVHEVVLRGVVAIRGSRLALLEGPDARAYVVRPGDRLHDGRVQEATGDGVLLLRDAADSIPLAERVVSLRVRDGERAR